MAPCCYRTQLRSLAARTSRYHSDGCIYSASIKTGSPGHRPDRSNQASRAASAAQAGTSPALLCAGGQRCIGASRPAAVPDQRRRNSQPEQLQGDVPPAPSDTPRRETMEAGAVVDQHPDPRDVLIAWLQAALQAVAQLFPVASPGPPAVHRGRRISIHAAAHTGATIARHISECTRDCACDSLHT